MLRGEEKIKKTQRYNNRSVLPPHRGFLAPSLSLSLSLPLSLPLISPERRRENVKRSNPKAEAGPYVLLAHRYLHNGLFHLSHRREIDFPPPLHGCFFFKTIASTTQNTACL
jgi:aspartyl/asparaginyl beta-hydroxylase (cupin superfamily)